MGATATAPSQTRLNALVWLGIKFGSKKKENRGKIEEILGKNALWPISAVL